MGEKQAKILALISDNPRISAIEIAGNINISATAVESDIKKLKEKGIIQRIRPDKGGYRKVVEK